jgi:hypothetical protein
MRTHWFFVFVQVLGLYAAVMTIYFGYFDAAKVYVG